MYITLAVKATLSTTASSKEVFQINVTLTYNRKLIWPPKPEMLISLALELAYVGSKFQVSKIPTTNLSFRLRRARRSCLQAITTTTDGEMAIWQQ